MINNPLINYKKTSNPRFLIAMVLYIITLIIGSIILYSAIYNAVFSTQIIYIGIGTFCFGLANYHNRQPINNWVEIGKSIFFCLVGALLAFGGMLV
jgi:hypothetical protein